MQLMWLSSPLGVMKTVTITRSRLIVLGAVAALALLVLGNVVHHVGFRLALEFRPELLRAMGGVMTRTDLERLDIEYRERLETLRSELQAMGQQVAELQALKDSYAQMMSPRLPVDSATKGDTTATDRLRKGAANAWSGLKSAMGGPGYIDDFSPAGVGAASLSGASLVEHLEESRRETRVLAQWMRQSQKDWAKQLTWLETQPTGMPVMGSASLSSRFGNRLDPFHRGWARHDGIDLVAPTGTPIIAAASGTVRKAFNDPEYGLVVELDHGNGYVTRYAHAHQLNVQSGDKILRGQQIATVGSTGRSTGPHLHFEVLYRGMPYDPELFLPPSSGVRVGGRPAAFAAK